MKEAGALLGVVLVAVWIGSAHGYVGWRNANGYWISVNRGRIAAGQRDRAAPPGWFGGRYPMDMCWWFDWTKRGSWRFLAVPLWVPAGLAMAAGAAAWRLDVLAWRRARTGYCPQCGYDCRGIPAGSPCPECGAGPGPIRGSVS